MTKSDLLAGRRILVVEDDFFIAEDMVATLAAAGVEVVGPASTVSAALGLIEEADRLDAAVLDVNLQGEMAYPLADALVARAVPFMFATGYDRGALPARFAGVTVCEKPLTLSQVARAMWG